MGKLVLEYQPARTSKAIRLANRARRCGILATLCVAVIPIIVLIGWTFDIQPFKSVVRGYVVMNPMTATLFLLAAAALGIRQTMVLTGGRSRTVIALCLVIVGVGSIKLMSYLAGWDVGIDRFLFKSEVLRIKNQMAPNTAMNFILVGVSLLLAMRKSRGRAAAAQGLSLAAAIVASVALLGYSYGTTFLYGVATFVPMALHTAICFLLTAIAIICIDPRLGFMALITRDTAGGALFRRSVPAALLVPAVLGYLRVRGHRAGLFDNEIGVALFAVSIMLTFGVLAWINARILEGSDERRLQAERELAQERNLLRSLIDNLPDHIYIKDASGKYVTDNAPHARFVGLKGPEEITGKTVADFFPPELATKYAADDQAVITSGEPLLAREEPIVTRGGDSMWLQTTKVPIRDSHGTVTGLVCMSRDISSRKRAEQEMLDIQNFLSSIIENIPNMVFVKDAENLRFVRFNKAGEDLLGYPRETLIGKNDYDLFPKEEADFFTAKDRSVLESGRLLDISTEPIITKTGERILHTKKIPIAVNGKPSYLLGISEDITDRVKADELLRAQYDKLQQMAKSEREAHDALKRAQSQMLQTEKLAAMGQLVAGVAHEINNPLSFVSNNVAVLQRDVAGIREVLELYRQADPVIETQNAELMNTIRELADRLDIAYTLNNVNEMMLRSRDGLKRIQQIVKDLRDFARLDESDLQDADLNSGIESTVNIIRGRAKGKQVQIELDLQPLPFVSCYPAKINQVIMNLVANAIDACNGGGTVTIRSTTSGDRQTIRVEVIDTGSGIEPHVRERIFDPFYTTKPQGEGTGLGLSISYGIVRDHKGTIEVDSSPGQGSTFTVTLPTRGLKPQG